MLCFLRTRLKRLLKWIWQTILLGPAEESLETQWQQMLDQRMILKRRILGENRRTMLLVQQFEDEATLKEWYECWREAMEDLQGHLRNEQTVETMQEVADFLLAMNNDLADLLGHQSNRP